MHPRGQDAIDASIEHHEVFSAAMWGTAWVGYWHAHSTAEGCDGAAESIRNYAHLVGVPIDVVAVLGPEVEPRFDAAVRQAAIRATQTIGEVMGRGAVVIARRGVLGSLIVSLSTGMLLIARASRVRVFLDTRDAGAWIAGGGRCEAARIVGAVEQLARPAR